MDGKHVVTCSRDRTAHVWETNTGITEGEFLGHFGWLNGAQFSPDGRFVVTSSNDRTSIVWDWAEKKTVARLLGHVERVNAAAFSQDGNLIISSGDDGCVRIFKCEVVTVRGYQELSQDSAGDQRSEVIRHQVCTLVGFPVS